MEISIITFIKDCDLGLSGETKQLSPSVAADLVARGYATAVDLNNPPENIRLNWSREALREHGLI